MQVIKRIEDLRNAVRSAGADGKTIGFVPTMGALHEGHLSLIAESVSRNDFTVVSVFVNPTQFAPAEDLAEYPRPFEADLEKCKDADVDVVFAPSSNDMYPEGFSTYVSVEGITEVFEGKSRPSHFRGVTTVVIKLLNLVSPDRIYFGMKDYQQLKTVETMIRDLNLDVDVVGCPIVREADGLALSSRNSYLSSGERTAATALYRALVQMKSMVESGAVDVETVRNAGLQIVQSEPLAEIDYLDIVDPERLTPLDDISGPAIALIAVRVGRVRLIDNMLIQAP